MSSEDKIRLERKINKYMNYGSKGEPSATQTYTSEKIKNLQRFLENVESESIASESDFDSSMHFFAKKDKKDRLPVHSEKENSQNATEPLTNSNATIIQQRTDKLNDDMLQFQLNKCTQLENELTVYKIELEEANKTIDSLKDMLSNDQIKIREQENQMRQQSDNRVKEQKEEYEEVIKRHLKFIDQLLLDKKELNSQVEMLTEQFKLIEEKNTANQKDIQEKYQQKLKANKEAWMSAEKMRKEKWLNEKTKEIKEVTIKGLEQDIEKIINRNKLEIRKLEENHRRTQGELRQKIEEEFEGKFQAFKERFLEEAEDQATQERLLKMEKTKEQIERVERNSQDEKERLKRQFEEEIKLVEEKRRNESEYYLKKIKDLQESHIDEIRQIKINSQNLLDENRYEAKQQLAQQKEQLKIESEKWMEKHISRQEAELAKKAQDLRKKLEKERDMQIEVIINKITEENTDADKQIAAKYELKMSQLQSEHLREVKELKRELSYFEDQKAKTSITQNSIQDNLQTLSKRLLEVQDNLNRSEWESKQLKQVITDLESQLTSCKDQMKINEEKIRKDMTLQIEKLQDQILVLNKTLSDLDTEHSQELQKAEEIHSKQLEDVEERVMAIVLKKDQLISRLKEDIQYKEITCTKLQQLLDKQRKDLVHNMIQN